LESDNLEYQDRDVTIILQFDVMEPGDSDVDWIELFQGMAHVYVNGAELVNNQKTNVTLIRLSEFSKILN
jgi:hypothetical protein